MLFRALYPDEIELCGASGIAESLRAGSFRLDIGRLDVSPSRSLLSRFCYVLLVWAVWYFPSGTAVAGFALSEIPKSAEQDALSGNSVLAMIYPDLFGTPLTAPLKPLSLAGAGAAVVEPDGHGSPKDPLPGSPSGAILTLALGGTAGRSSTSSSGQWNLLHGSDATGLYSGITVPPTSGLWSWMRLSDFLHIPTAPGLDVFRPPPIVPIT